jgi:PTH1 family peptidyl-tRNA hydrolase
VVETLASRLGTRLRKVRFHAIEAGETHADGERMLLVRPRSYMNVSGPPVAGFARRRRIETEHVVVCHDEIDLPLGALRIKRGGSSAGHRGVDSVVQALGSKDFHRIRLGVGRPPGSREAADHVLKRLGKAELEEVDLLIEEAADAVLTLVRAGLTAAQERHNRAGPPAP